MFSGAHNFIANIYHATGNSSSGPGGIDILLEASAPGATCDSGARTYSPRCFPGTRKQYIEDFIQWAVPAPYDSPLPLYWMNGAAGVGKSAVAQTSAEEIKRSGLLGASFFFSTNGTNDPSTFFPSIAYQLSVKFDDYRELVNKEILRDKTLVHKAMETQFRDLIVGPLLELERQGKGIGKRIVIIVDGLDECEGVEAQCTIIEAVATSLREGAIPLVWAFFSRPESHIEATFSQKDVNFLCYKMVLPVSHDADSDVELYLRGSFDNILRRRNIPMESQWPSDHDLKMIVKAANGLFIYATAVYRFVTQPGWVSLDEPLQAVLAVITQADTKISLSNSTPLHPFAELDAFYLLIMRRIPQRMLPYIRLLLGFMCLPFINEGATVIANLLRLSKAEIHALCAQMSAVLKFHQGNSFEDVLDPGWDMDRPFYKISHFEYGPTFFYLQGNTICGLGGQICFYHKSFQDFIVDPLRSGEFCIKSSADYQSLFDKLWELRLDYEETYCFESSELVLDPSIPDSAFSLSYPYKNELVNSLIKVSAYEEASSQCRWLADQPELGITCRKRMAMADFRKELHIHALLSPKPRVTPTVIHRQKGLLKYIENTRLVQAGQLGWLDEGIFLSLVATLKMTIEEQQQAGIIRPYSPQCGRSSEFKSSYRENPRFKVESGLYLIGHEFKAIFWFWEVNYRRREYREFRTANLAEGEKIYRREVFELWELE